MSGFTFTYSVFLAVWSITGKLTSANLVYVLVRTPVYSYTHINDSISILYVLPAGADIIFYIQLLSQLF